MARLSATTALLLAAVAFFIAAGAAEAGQPHNGDAITKDFIFARGIKLHVAKQGTATDHIFAGGSKLSVARHDAAAADHASARGSKLDVTQSKVSIPLMSKLAVPKMRLAVSESKVSIPLMSKLAVPKMRLAALQSKVSIPLMSKLAVPKSRLAVSEKVSIPLMSKIAIPKSRLAVSESKVSVPKKDFIFSEGRKLIGGAAAETAGAAPGALQACDQLEAYQRVCHTLLHLPGVTTPRALLETAVRVALGRARAAKVTFDAAKLASGTGNPMASILGSCEQNYDDLVDALEGVSRAMQKPGVTGESLVTKMTAASTYAGDCDNWYEERDVKSPYEVMQRHLAQMVSVALGLANKIKKL